MLIISELGLRFAHHLTSEKEAESGLSTLLQKSEIPGLVWQLTPGFKSDKYQINASGFRGAEFPAAKDSAVQRIACIGDSHCFGMGVYDDSRIYPSLLQAQLQKISPVEVLNFGVPGYNTWQEFAQLENIVLNYAPDFVVLGFFFNDADGNTAIETASGRQKLGEQKNGPTSKSLSSWLKQSYLVMALKNGIERAGLALFDYHPNYIDLKIKSARWQEMKNELAEMAEVLADRNIPLLVVVFPMTYQLAHPETVSAAQQDILSFLSEKKIEYINLFPIFRRFLQANDFEYKKLIVKGIRDSHPTATGHALVAEEIVKYMLNKK